MEQEALARRFKALSNPQRLKIFRMLCAWQVDGEQPEGDLCEGVARCFTRACCEVGLSRSTISHHFKELQNAGLIAVTRSGQSFVCRINMEAVDELRQFLQHLPSRVADPHA